MKPDYDFNEGHRSFNTCAAAGFGELEDSNVDVDMTRLRCLLFSVSIFGFMAHTCMDLADILGGFHGPEARGVLVLRFALRRNRSQVLGEID